MIDVKDTNVRGAGAMVTSVHHYLLNGEPIFPTSLPQMNIGDEVVLLDHRLDAELNMAIWNPRFRSQTFRVAGACLTLLPSQPPVRLPDRAFLTREIAAHVLYVFSGTGYAPGSFIRSLIDALVKADPGNRALVALGHPGYAEAVRLASSTPDGMKYLQAVLRQEWKVIQHLEKVGQL